MIAQIQSFGQLRLAIFFVYDLYSLVIINDLSILSFFVYTEVVHDIITIVGRKYRP